jgi:predicted dehydrogenase
LIRLAVAGAGNWGLNHVRDLATMRRARLAWVVDPDEERLARAQRLAPGAGFVADIEPALADPTLDGLVIASPTPTHAPLARRALAAGKHVLVEKPLAPDAETAEELVRLAREAGRHLAVGHLLLYHPGVQRLKALVDRGRLGPLLYLAAQRTNHGRIRTDEGALIGLGPHDVSVMSYLVGAWPVGVSARGARYAQPEYEDLIFLILRFPGQVLGHVHLSWLDPLKVRRLSVVGERAMAVLDDMDREVPLRVRDVPAPGTAGLATARPVPVSRDLALRRELQAFVRALETGEPCPTPGEDGARVARVLDAARASLESAGGEVRVNPR